MDGGEDTERNKSEPVTDPVLERRIEALEAELRQRDRAVIEEAQRENARLMEVANVTS